VSLYDLGSEASEGSLAHGSGSLAHALVGEAGADTDAARLDYIRVYGHAPMCAQWESPGGNEKNEAGSDRKQRQGSSHDPGRASGKRHAQKRGIGVSGRGYAASRSLGERGGAKPGVDLALLPSRPLSRASSSGAKGPRRARAKAP
jgi:hypothetical protein